MGLVNKLLGPSRKDQVLAASKAPAKAAPSAAESNAVVLETEDSDVTTAGTNVYMPRSKKASRKGVPGLGL